MNRFQVPVAQAAPFRGDVEELRAALARCPGFVRGRVGRNLDDPALWVLVTEWENVGSYRRSLSAYDVKMAGVRLLDRAIDEPSGYEQLDPGRGLADLDRRTGAPGADRE